MSSAQPGQSPRGARPAGGGQRLPGRQEPVPRRLPSPEPPRRRPRPLRASARACQEVCGRLRNGSRFPGKGGGGKKKKKEKRGKYLVGAGKSEGSQPAGSAEPGKGLCPPGSPAELWRRGGRGEKPLHALHLTPPALSLITRNSWPNVCCHAGELRMHIVNMN